MASYYTVINSLSADRHAYLQTLYCTQNKEGCVFTLVYL